MELLPLLIQVKNFIHKSFIQPSHIKQVPAGLEKGIQSLELSESQSKLCQEILEEIRKQVDSKLEIKKKPQLQEEDERIDLFQDEEEKKMSERLEEQKKEAQKVKNMVGQKRRAEAVTNKEN